MGSGKSTLGKPIARALGCNFYDLDNYIEQQTGSTIAAIFEQQGEAAFRALETKYLEELSAANENCVISTGGGTPCFGDNMEMINSLGMSVYLQQEVSVLTHRLLNSKISRPLIAGKTPEQLRSFIEQKLAEREPYYKRASITVADAERDASRIINVLKFSTQI